MNLFSTVVLVSILTAPGFVHAQAEPPQRQKTVLVTGASTGIGRKTTERLAADGFFVYAGARKASDLETLSKIKNPRWSPLACT